MHHPVAPVLLQVSSARHPQSSSATTPGMLNLPHAG
jgi:hypothetical protein